MAQTRPTDPPAVRIEPENEWAWCGERRLELTPKTFAVLRHLAERAGRLVTKRELLDAVWPDTVVSEAALTSCIRDLRRALADSSRAPRYIETAHRRGFRFIGPIDRCDGPASGAREAPGAAPAADDGPGRAPEASPGAARPADDAVAAAIAAPTLASEDPTLRLAGREGELARLRGALASALAGRRQVVFVTGEAGIGKSTLVEAFATGLGASGVRVGRGQCVEQFGAGEAYLPVLEALGRLGREAAGARLVQVLKQIAPTWLAQLPALLTDAELEAVRRRAQGTTRERMLRELIEALDALAAEAPLVLVLEDLHWSDAATIDLLALLARRPDPARLLVLGTYRPADVAAAGHPLRPVKQELQAHGQCDELVLDFLSEDAVAAYLAARFPGKPLPADLTRLLRESSGGNPLFLVNLVDDLVAQGHLHRVDGAWTLATTLERIGSTVPHSLTQLVDKQLESLTPSEQAVLAVGSVAGADFSSALSTTAGLAADDGERCCDALARRGQLLRALGEVRWPDGTVAGRYGFIHAVYRNAVYARVPIGHRVGLHLRIGSRLELAHGARAADVAGELAMHFEEGRDFERAVRYRAHAAAGALRRQAYREAVGHATRALELQAELPDGADRRAQELEIQTALGAAVIATRGWGDPAVAGAYGRARELCARAGSTPKLFPVLLGMCGFYLMRGELDTASGVSRQLVALADATGDGAIRLGASNTAGLVSFYRGDFRAALEHFERAGRTYDPDQHSPNRLRAYSVDHDPGVSCAAHTALTLAALGRPDRARERMEACLALARSIDHPLSHVMALNFAASFYQEQRERDRVAEIEGERSAVAAEHGFELFVALGEIYRGWLDSIAGGGEAAVARIRTGIEVYRLVGAALGTPTFLAILAGAEEAVGRRADALATLGEALAIAEQTGLRYWDAELHRLRGDILLGANGAAPRGAASPAEREGEACLRAAVESARRSASRRGELRAATSLARLWHARGESERARELLGAVRASFAEGAGTPDLRDADAVLGALGTPDEGARTRPAAAARRSRPTPRRR